jgi:RNA polymerase sigma-70 factor (ECF subfamily)
MTRYKQARAQAQPFPSGLQPSPASPMTGPAQASQPPDIGLLLEAHRQELLAYCYRLLGSLHDAEDQVQETLLRAWRHFQSLKDTTSLRAWLYKIATNACLDALKQRPARTLPLAAFPAADPAHPIASPLAEATWLEPFPTSWLTEAAENPETRYTRTESISLAFLTALQLLSPRQRAILILADVLDWRASEIAQLLNSSTAAINAALHRARVTLEKHYRPPASEPAQPGALDDTTRQLLTRYLQAWESDDVEGLVALLKEDATLSMPPYAAWYQGHAAIRAILTACPLQPAKRRQWRLLPTVANGQPAFAVYRADAAQQAYRAYGIQVISLQRDATERARLVTSVIMFHTASLVTRFGLPEQLPIPTSLGH